VHAANVEVGIAGVVEFDPVVSVSCLVILVAINDF